MIDPGSFRDPSGYIIHKERKVFRIINYLYKDHYDHLMNSGLYDKLIEEGLLITHEEVENSNIKDKQYKTLEVKKIPFISYPYEWSFSQLKDALLLTLKIQKICIDYNMTLKDATPFNIQFLDNKPIFIDTLSFEVIKNENYTWKPYKQFCEMSLSFQKKIRYNKSIVEIKFPIELRESLDTMFRRTELTPSRHSKYLVGLSKLCIVSYI